MPSKTYQKRALQGIIPDMLGISSRTAFAEQTAHCSMEISEFNYNVDGGNSKSRLGVSPFLAQGETPLGLLILYIIPFL